MQTHINAEQQLLDTLKRIEPFQVSCSALVIRISALSPENKASNQIKIIARTLNNLIAQSQANLFILSNCDMVILGKNIPVKVIQDAKETVLALCKYDAFVKTKPAIFVKSLSLRNDFETLVNYAEERKRILLLPKNQQNEEVPLAPEHLDAILRNIQGFKILQIIRRQEALEISNTGGITSLFFKYFTSMMDLKKAIAPDVNVLSNRWLFQHLTETLDKRMLGIWRDLFAHTPKNISLSLNISTITLPDFIEFLDKIPERTTLIVEVQLMDIIQNTQNYFKAKELLKQTGHKILIDGVVPASFEFMDIATLEPDLVKLNWTTKLNSQAETDKIKPQMEKLGTEKIILMRSEDESSLAWAFKNGINKFQGYFIDKLSAALLYKTCPKRKSCSLKNCTARKAEISKQLRMNCLAPERLDKEFNIKGGQK